MNKLTIRRWHTYLGLFIAPSVLFFSLTGAVQLFSLHEAHGDYTPAPLVIGKPDSGRESLGVERWRDLEGIGRLVDEGRMIAA